MLTPADVRELQQEIERTMDCTATIKRLPTPGTKLPGGGTSAVLATIATNQPCFLKPYSRRPDEPLLGAALVESNLWVVGFPAGQDVTARDIYEVSGSTKGVVWLRTLEAVGVLDRHSYPVKTAVVCKQPGGAA